MVDLGRPVTVEVDGWEVYNQKITADPKFILENFLENRDRELLYVNKMTIKL
jgi:hypothetical protein